jgi:hypothetical protein
MFKNVKILILTIQKLNKKIIKLKDFYFFCKIFKINIKTSIILFKD